MVSKFPDIKEAQTHRKDNEIGVHLDLSFDLPEKMATQLEELGIYEFERCVYDQSRRRMYASVSTTLYQKNA